MRRVKLACRCGKGRRERAGQMRSENVDAIEVQQGGRWCHRAACRGRRPRSAEYRGDGLLATRVVDETSVLVQTTRSVRSHDEHHLSVGTCSRHFAVPANDNSNCLTSQVSVQCRAGMVSPQHGGLRKSVHLHHKLLWTSTARAGLAKGWQRRADFLPP